MFDGHLPHNHVWVSQGHLLYCRCGALKAILGAPLEIALDMPTKMPVCPDVFPLEWRFGNDIGQEGIG